MSSLPSACAVQVQGCAVHVKGGAGIGARRGDEKAAKSGGHGEAAAARRLRLGAPHHQALRRGWPLVAHPLVAHASQGPLPSGGGGGRGGGSLLLGCACRARQGSSGRSHAEPRVRPAAQRSCAQLLHSSSVTLECAALILAGSSAIEQSYDLDEDSGGGGLSAGSPKAAASAPCQAAARPAAEPAAERHAPMSSPTTRHGHLALLRARGPARRPAGCGRRVAAASATQPAIESVSNVFPRAVSDVH